MEIDYSEFDGEISLIPSGVTGYKPVSLKEANKRRIERLGGTSEPLLTLSESAKLIGISLSALKSRKEAKKFIAPVATTRKGGSIKYLYSKHDVMAYKLAFPSRKVK